MVCPDWAAEVRELVAFATRLRAAAGTYQAALVWTDVLSKRGIAAFAALGLRGDAAVVMADKARAIGLLTEAGADRVKVAALIMVLDILNAVPETSPMPPSSEPLVFTVPRAVEALVTLAQRLDLLVTDVIARANTSLHIGGPFWNEGGWDLLRPVVLPALKVRGVPVTFYLHPHESGHLGVLHAMLDEAAQHGEVATRWWAGGFPSLMHAKFIVADGCRGYFGTANLTSLGLGAHLEMGVALTEPQAASLLSLLDGLEGAQLFTATEPASR